MWATLAAFEGLPEVLCISLICADGPPFIVDRLVGPTCELKIFYVVLSESVLLLIPVYCPRKGSPGELSLSLNLREFYYFF